MICIINRFWLLDLTGRCCLYMLSTMKMPVKTLPLISCCVCALVSCTHVAENGVTSEPAKLAESAESDSDEVTLDIISGHLICAATHTFFAPDADDFERLCAYDSPSPSGLFMVPLPPAEPYFEFRSTYLPPVHSYLRVECSDTEYEISAAWDEVCPVRVKVMFDKKTGAFKGYTDYAPADADFLNKLADEYNRVTKGGIYAGIAGTPTTEDMRGKAVAADAEFPCDEEEMGPYTRRFLAEGMRISEAAFEKAEAVDIQERNYVRDFLGYEPRNITGGHTDAWMLVDSAGKRAQIVGTPYCLHFKQVGEVWKLYFEGTDGTCLELPFREYQTLPFDAVYNENAKVATMLYLAPDRKGLVVDPYYGADHEEYEIIYISWRNGAPKVEEPIRCCKFRDGETDERFVGWKENTPVTEFVVEFVVE